MDPIVEQRVGPLEERMQRVKTILVRLEPKLNEFIYAGAKASDLAKLKSDMTADLTKLRLDVAADLMKTRLDISTEITKVHVDVAEVKGRMASLPTYWVLMVSLISTWSVGASIVFALVKATHP